MKKGRTDRGAAKKNKKGVKSPFAAFFDSKAGIFVATVMALFLWWVPYLGPMAAGFMGGRKAGSMYRGLLVGIVSCFLLLLITGLLSVGVSALYEGDFAGPVEEFSTGLYDALGMLSDYLGTFIVVTDTGFEFDQATYFLMGAMAFIGGVFADQARKEVKAISELVKGMNQAEPPRSMKAYREHRTVGFRSYDDYADMSVNVSQVRERPAEKKSAPSKRQAETAYPEVQVQVQQSQPTNTVLTSSISTSTVTETVPDAKKRAFVPSSDKDDYEFL